MRQGFNGCVKDMTHNGEVHWLRFFKFSVNIRLLAFQVCAMRQTVFITYDRSLLLNSWLTLCYSGCNKKINFTQNSMPEVC